MEREPDFEDRASFYLCHIAAALYNVNRAPGATSLSPSDVDPWFDAWADEQAEEQEEFASLDVALKPKP